MIILWRGWIEMKINEAYLEILKLRLEYFKDKKITELNNSEIQEYLNLKKEFNKIFAEVKEIVNKAWNTVYGESWEIYRRRVLEKVK